MEGTLATVLGVGAFNAANNILFDYLSARPTRVVGKVIPSVTGCGGEGQAAGLRNRKVGR
jgi:hypothetical protein